MVISMVKIMGNYKLFFIQYPAFLRKNWERKTVLFMFDILYKAAANIIATAFFVSDF
jgi:hypothetical protein